MWAGLAMGKNKEKEEKKGKGKKPREENEEDILPPSKKAKTEDNISEVETSVKEDTVEGERLICIRIWSNRLVLKSVVQGSSRPANSSNSSCLPFPILNKTSTRYFDAPHSTKIVSGSHNIHNNYY